MNHCFLLLILIATSLDSVSLEVVDSPPEQKVVSPTQSVAARNILDNERTERVAAAGKVWAFVETFHPYLTYRQIDWDAAWEAAAPAITEAREASKLTDALRMLLEPLGDAATRVVDGGLLSRSMDSADPLPSWRWVEDGILVVTIRNPRPAVIQKASEELKKVAEALLEAKAVVFDLRGSFVGDYLLKSSGVDRLLSTTPIRMPQTRRRMHSGYASPHESRPGPYYSAWVVSDVQDVQPALGARDVRSVFLMDADTSVPDTALGLQYAGKAAIICESQSLGATDDGAQLLKVTDEVHVAIRFAEFILPDGSPPSPNATFPNEPTISEQSPAFKAAVEAARSGQWPRPERIRPASANAAPKSRDAGGAYPSPALRQLAAIKIWATFEHFFPYKHLMGEDWSQILLDYLPRLEAVPDARQYYLTIAEMLAQTHDSHVAAVSSGILLADVHGAPTAAELRWIENEPVVVGFRDTVDGLEAGDIIRKIDGRPYAERMEFLKKITPASTPQALMWQVTSRLLNGPYGSEAEIEAEGRDGKRKTVKLRRRSGYWRAPERAESPYRMLPDNIGYVNLVELAVSQVDEMFETLKQTRAIILDMRGYPKGTAWAIAPRLTDRTDVAAARFRRPIVMAPTSESGQYQSVWNTHEFLQAIPPISKWRYRGKTAMLIDERAMSQSEHSGLFYEAANGTEFVGSPTAGANGDVTAFTVPGGIRITFSGHDVRHADGRQLQRVGLKPDVEVRPTIAGIRSGRDEVLERAIEYVNEIMKK